MIIGRACVRVTPLLNHTRLRVTRMLLSHVPRDEPQSLYNIMDSCGPSNAVSNLSKHTQRDNSLQNDVIRRNGPQNNQQFRNNQIIDNNLNQEFNQFSGNQFNGSFDGGNQFANQFMSRFPMKGRGQNRNQGWVNDFSNLSLERNELQTRDMTREQGWNQQFMNGSQQYNQQQQNSQQFNQQQQNIQHQFQQNQLQQNQVNQQIQPQMPFHMNTRTNLNPVYHEPVGNLTEHQEMHKMEQQHQQFEDEFKLLEQEMHSNTTDKEEFAKTARKIHESMTNNHEQNEKIQQSNFLKLMNSISNRSVELSNEGDKLVDSQSGQDVREQEITEHLSDPLRDVKESSETVATPDYHRPMYSDAGQVVNQRQAVNQEQPQEQTQEQTQQADPHHNPLPDPLAHIQDGALSNIQEPLQAARIISGNQVVPEAWMEDWDHQQEMWREYDAYTHHDE